MLDSDYLRKTQARFMRHDRCAYCGHHIFPIHRGERRPQYQATRDHILPRCLGTVSHIGCRATRPACSDCNVKRAKWGHCVGVLMLVLIEDRHRGLGRWESAKSILPEARMVKRQTQEA